MITEAFNKAEIAYRYYKLVTPDRDYSKEQARKQFHQESNIDVPTLKKVIDGIYKEQVKLIKS